MDELHAVSRHSMWAAWTCPSESAMLISAPQKQRERPSASCVGTLQPASHMACFQRSNASWRPDRSKSCSVSLGRSVMQPA
jgi:hypothetical protein